MAQPSGSIARPSLVNTAYQNRLNFWSSFNAKPKPKHKFIVRFGNNAFFGTDTNIEGLAGNIDIDLSLGGFAGLDAISNLAWVVKSVNRPTFRVSYRDALYEGNGEWIGYEPVTIKDAIWEPITVKFVNVTNYSFYPSEMPKDLDYLLSLLIHSSGFQWSRTSRTAKVGVDNFNIKAENSNKDAFSLRSRQLFEPFEIIDLSNDVQNNGNYADYLGHPVQQKDLPKQGHFPIGKWILYEPNLIEVNFGENNYESDNQFIEYTMKIGYQWAEYESYANSNPANNVPEGKFGSNLPYK